MINKENVVSLAIQNRSIFMNLKIIYFTSPGCSICVKQTSILDEIQSEKNIEIENYLITTAFDKALAFGVKSAPSMVFLSNGKNQIIKTGFQSKNYILEIIEQLIEIE